MNKVTALLTFTCLLIASVCFASTQDAQEAALRTFQPILKEVDHFFSKNPKLLVKISPPGKPDQTAYFSTHFIHRGTYYDIVTTNSIVTPYRGFIDIDTEVFDNKPCGSLSFDNRVRDGWSKAAEAIDMINNDDCYVSRTQQSGPVRHRFVFAYQALEKKWALGEILYRDGQPNGRFLVLRDIPSPWFPVVHEPKVREINRPWYDLFKGF